MYVSDQRDRKTSKDSHWQIVAREQAKAEKQARFDAKMKAKQQSDASPAAPNPKKEKEKKVKEAEKESLAEYVEETPKGQKKGQCYTGLVICHHC